MCEHSDKTIYLQALPQWDLAPAAQVQPQGRHSCMRMLLLQSCSLWSADMRAALISRNTTHLVWYSECTNWDIPDMQTACDKWSPFGFLAFACCGLLGTVKRVFSNWSGTTECGQVLVWIIMLEWASRVGLWFNIDLFQHRTAVTDRTVGTLCHLVDCWLD